MGYGVNPASDFVRRICCHSFLSCNPLSVASCCYFPLPKERKGGRHERAFHWRDFCELYLVRGVMWFIAFSDHQRACHSNSFCDVAYSAHAFLEFEHPRFEGEKKVVKVQVCHGRLSRAFPWYRLLFIVVMTSSLTSCLCRPPTVCGNARSFCADFRVVFCFPFRFWLLCYGAPK